MHSRLASNSLRVFLCFSVMFASGCPKAPNYREVLENQEKQEEQLRTLLGEMKEELKSELIAELRSEFADGSISSGAIAASEPEQVFDPPATLDELDQQVTWVDSPVIDSLELYREYLKDHPPEVSVEEALKLKNDSDENNEKILSSLGQLYATDEDADFSTEIVRHLPSEVKSLNPLMQSSTVEGDVVGMIGLGFFSFDWNMDPFAVAEYVDSWQTSEDMRFDKVVIRDDITWSDGTPVSAYDVEFSYHTILDEEIPIPAVRTGMDDILGIKAYDERTFVIFHKHSLATNVWNCNFPIIPKHVYEETIKDDKTMADSDEHIKLEQKPVCGGPYIVKSRSKSEIVLERRDDWYMHNGEQVRRKPHFKTVRFKVITDPNTQLLALNRGDIDDLELQPAQWVNQTTEPEFYRLNTKVRGTQWVYYFFGWNMKTPYFSDLRVRKAMAYAVDYDYILNTLLYGLWPACSSEFHPDSWMGPEEPRAPYKQDLKKAVALLEEAGWKDTDQDGIRDKVVNGKKIPFQFTMLTPNQPWRVDVCNSLSTTLQRIGVKCNVMPTEFTVVQDKTSKHEFQALFGGWGTGTDPWTTENIFKTDEGRNYVQYSNKRVDELFDKAKVELDRDVRAEYYREIDEILWEEQPYCWLFYRGAFYAYNKRLRGYKFSPRGPYHYSPGFDSIWATAQ
ncbi:Oligopeptide-binding protein AppA precursor [Thalassoglobus neptunius]|uniref:Oligopeptide-binding protein AppA n=1 Tax=Thalassoglobus neptunius TaxID=1938619 RepID=A0A5C5X3X3_9PLAN|nr:ABC transporter substrate-binding protein [Thalassoglobus neptunius]TWT57560.1 Oligopeptide-binding protein AppA precursor [Thalassoglobus neptunius]